MRLNVEPIEPALSDARERLKSRVTNDADVHRALRAARDFLELHRETQPEEYDFHPLLAEVHAAYPNVQLDNSRSARQCRGDREQVGAAIRAAIQSMEFEADTALKMSIELDGDVPLVCLELDGPGKIHDPWLLGGHVSMGWDELEPCWTRATRGGRFDRRPGAIELRLAGIRVIPENSPPPVELLDAVRTAERSMRMIVGDASDDSAADRTAALAAIDRALEVIDGESGRGPEPADIPALLAETVEERRPHLERSSITCESQIAADAPAIVVNRARMRSAFANLLNWAPESLARGGAVSIVFDYDATNRHAELLVDYTGTQFGRSNQRLLDSIRRAVEEIHHGRLEITDHDSGMSVVLTIPDPVGRELDTWIPGFDAFSDRSRQMLRLLKSGGPTPPEDFILGGVLEEELERLLLPRISVAPATNLAHDLKAAPSGLPGSSAERLDKALTQIRKGKPKKEICKPQYAAEIIWVFRADERHRAALGVEALDEEALRVFCTELLKSPPGYVTALQMLARCHGKSSL